MAAASGETVDRGSVVPWSAVLLVALLGVVLRLLHNAAMMESPLYWHPLGGHLVFLKTAEAIASGDLFPGSRPFADNSPLYPYVLALGYKAFGVNYLLTRFLTILADTGTIMLVGVLGTRHFGRITGVVAALIYAVYAPAIFYSDELIYISYALLCLTAALLLLDGRSTAASFAAGITTGIAIDFMPTLALIAPLMVAAPLVMGSARALRRTLLMAAAIAITILPVTAINYFNSGELVLLTTSAGHNFYIGHNPQARAGYHMPTRIDSVPLAARANTFDNMKTLAETVEGRPFTDTEVSSYYFRKALTHIWNHPREEVGLALARLAAVANAFEATTYSDFYFQRQMSSVLRAAPTFDFLLPLALIGLLGLGSRRRFPLLAPVITAIASVLIFFFIDRFRMPMIPVLCVFAGHGVERIVGAIRRRAWQPVFAGAAVCAIAFTFARVQWVTHDSANEWNKVGAVWQSVGEFQRAAAAYEEAHRQNARDPNAYLNLARLYEQTGDRARAEELRGRADALTRAGDGDAFRDSLVSLRSEAP